MSRPLNFRDVGECLAILSEGVPVLRSGLLFRGGKIDASACLADLGGPRSIVNLRRGPDPAPLEGVKAFHVPADNTLENYRTEDRAVQAWLRNVLGVLTSPETPWPVYVHCTSGKDRTGVVVAALLAALDVPEPLIVEEYLLSEDVDVENILHALDGLKSVRRPLVDRRLLRLRIEAG